MILRLRHAVPLLQQLGGWTTRIPLPPIARLHAKTDVASAATGSIRHAEDLPDAASSSAPAKLTNDTAIERVAEPKLELRAAYVDNSVDSTNTLPPAVPTEGENGNVGLAASTSVSKRRTAARHKASSLDEPQPSDQAGADAAAAVPPQPKRTTSRSKQVRTPLTTTAASAEDATTQASGHPAPPASGVKKRSSRAVQKKPADEAVGVPATGRIIQDLPYEDFLVLPRKAEQVLITLGLLQAPPPPHLTPSLPSSTAAAAESSPAAAPASPDASEAKFSFRAAAASIRNVIELAELMGCHRPKDLAPPLLIAQYQGYLGSSPDLLYDLFCLDLDVVNLPSEVVRAAASEAAVAARSSSVLNAKGLPADGMLQAALGILRRELGAEALEKQETGYKYLTEAQLELFLMDWASASLAGTRDMQSLNYLSRRCAALQLTRPIVLERLYQYAVQGASLQQLAEVRGGRAVKLTQPMEALVEGLKAGVALERERLLRDFMLVGPGCPMAHHLPEVEAMIAREAAHAAEPGGISFYTTLTDKMRLRPGLRAAIEQQESWWVQHHGDRDGNALTMAQMRVLFHLGRRERFQREHQLALQLLQQQQQQQAAGSE